MRPSDEWPFEIRHSKFINSTFPDRIPPESLSPRVDSAAVTGYSRRTMKILSAEFVTSAASPSEYPKDRLPEIAFAGRSNVGKSSMMNTLLSRRSLVKVSGTPGKTRRINFFRINGKFTFVDLPGYGYAKVSRETQAAWGPMIEEYVQGREFLRLLVCLVDLRHEPTALDQSLRAWLLKRKIPHLFVGTKADKLARGARLQAAAAARATLGLGPEESFIAFSSITREGAEEVWHTLKAYMGDSPRDP